MHRSLLLILAGLGTVVSTEARAVTFIVNDNDHDLVDNAPGDGYCIADLPSGGQACTLRAAVMEANALVGRDTIELAPVVYKLTINGAAENGSEKGDLDITSPMTIIGDGPQLTIIDAGDLVPRDRVFHVLDGPVTFQDLQIRRGAGQAYGTGIFDQNAAVTLHRVWVRDNRAVVDGGGARATGAAAMLIVTESSFLENFATVNGGGIALDNGATMSMEESSVLSNQAIADGGGVYVHGGATATLTDDTLDDNIAATGGGIANEGATTAVINGKITNGAATLYGGGVANLDGAFSAGGTTIEGNSSDTGGGIFQAQISGVASTTLGQVTLFGNLATGDGGGGGVYATGGGLTIDRSRVDSNQATTGPGGGLVLDATTSTMTITYTTIVENDAATDGGGIACPYAGAMIAIERSTIDHNSATGNGGGVFGAALGASQVLKSTITSNTAGAGGGLWLGAETATTVVALLHSTISHNNVHGLWFGTSGVFRAYHVILAANVFADCANGVLTSRGYNLVQSPVCTVTPQATDILLKPANLGALRDNGGPTWTRAITSASRAYNAGHLSDCMTGGPFDQRKERMPVGRCDIGAYEAP